VEKRNWSDTVAGKTSHESETTIAATNAIETVITTGIPLLRKGPNQKDMSKSIQLKRGQENQISNKPQLIIIGDSHSRGAAGEIRHQSNRRIITTGYVKPNSRLAEVINTANNVSGNLTKRDALVLIRGSNDIDINTHSHNITSLARFLQNTRNTNIILTEVPPRYDD
jgi:hypothetical protein